MRLKPRASCVFQSENAISHTVVRKTNIFSLRYACDPWLKSHYECVASSGRNEETIRKFHSGIFGASPPFILKLLHYTLVVRLKPRASCVFQSENAISHTVVRKTNIFSLRYACDPWLKSHYECVASSGRNEETIRKFHIAVPKVSFDFHLNSILVEVAWAYICIYIYICHLSMCIYLSKINTKTITCVYIYIYIYAYAIDV